MHARYLQQAAWTRDLRDYLFGQTAWHSARRILEVGCGTGAILRNPSEQAAPGTPEGPSLFGVDRSSDALAECRIHAPSAMLTCADVLALPYSAGSFDITYCHFVLLWVKDPLAALREMRRVTRRHVLALAEPDYSARVDQPQELAPLGQLQNQALARAGRRCFAGCTACRSLRSGRHSHPRSWRHEGTPAWPLSPQRSLNAEWSVLQQDLTDTVPADELEEFRRLDASARQHGRRLLHVPTYYVWGQV